jgi:hypothetical protein
LFHFLSGSCVLHRCSSSGTRACRTFAVGFSSETDMVGYVLDMLPADEVRPYPLVCN